MSGCVNIALRDILAGSAAGGYGCQPLKAGGAAQPGGCSACFVPVEPGSWDLSMKVPCFVDGRGILVELSMKSACFMDEGSVLVCLSMKSLDFMDGWGFEEGCPQNRVVFEGVVPVRGVFWARVEVLMRRAWRWRGKKYESWLLGRDSM